jgi:flavodoxin I
MKVLVLYDSEFGNTRQIAETIGAVFEGEAEVIRASDAEPAEFARADLLIIGSPTQGGRPTAKVMELLGRIPADGLTNLRVAAFDTRVTAVLPLRVLLNLVGYAAPRMARILQARGGSLVVPPAGFIVTGQEGPLGPAELARATSWARDIRAALPAATAVR